MGNIDANKLKEYIIENNYIEMILVALGCHDVKEHTSEWRAALPNGNNKTAICVKKDTLSTAIRSSELNEYGDIYTLTMNIKSCSFGRAVKYLHQVLGLKYSYTQKHEVEKKDPLALFKKIKKRRYVIDKDAHIYDENCIKEYVSLPYIEWVREGIMPNACKRFNIGYSFDKKRITIPERQWDGGEDDYIGVSGRTTIPNYELFDIPKYVKMSPTYPKGMNIYGLNENYKSIQNKGYVVVMESQKSVLKRYSLGDETAVSIGCCELTSEQVKILIGLNVEIIIALDEGIDINHIRKECDKFYPIRKISYMYDKWGLIPKGSKNSPADMRNKIYNFLFKHRFTYDETERKEYKTWQEKQRRN